MTAVQTMWIIDPFSDCSAECSPEGQRTRTVTCSSTVGGVTETVPDQDCLDAGQPRPATNQSCGVDCPYRWERSEYGNCSTSTTCGNGTQTRTVTCVRDIPSRGAVAQRDDACSSVGDKPRSERPCTTICSLFAGPWSDCSVTCGRGTRRRDLTCQRQDGTEIDLQFCAGLPTLASTEDCDLVPSCPTTQIPTPTPTQPLTTETPTTAGIIFFVTVKIFPNAVSMTAVQTMWIIDPFSDCSAECSPEGQRTRTVTCSSTVGGVAETVPDQDCLDANMSKPLTFESCGVDCPYRWERSEYGNCSTSTTCGNGTQTRTVTCVRDIPSRGSVAQRDDACSSVGDKPRSERPCTTICSLFAGPWSDCSVTCGRGTRRRDLTCQRQDGTEIDLQFCAGLPTLASTEDCDLVPSCPTTQIPTPTPTQPLTTETPTTAGIIFFCYC